MKTYKLQSNDVDIHIECPECKNWEELGVDDPRKNLNALPIVEWMPDSESAPEVSIHECTACNTKFKVIWDYDNPIK